MLLLTFVDFTGALKRRLKLWVSTVLNLASIMPLGFWKDFVVVRVWWWWWFLDSSCGKKKKERKFEAISGILLPAEPDVYTTGTRWKDSVRRGGSEMALKLFAAAKIGGRFCEEVSTIY